MNLFKKIIALTLVITFIAPILPQGVIQVSAASYDYTVTTTADKGPGSLRAAADKATPGQTIGFSFEPGTELLITLEKALSLRIGVTIDGANAPGLVVSVKESGYDHIISNSGDPDSALTLKNLTFAGLGTEVKDAGGICVIGDLRMENVRVLNTYGGGVYAGGRMDLIGCEIMGNVAESGNVYLNDSRIGVVTARGLFMIDTSVRGNGGNDKHIVVATKGLDMKDSTIENNACTRQGGGVYVGEEGAWVTNSTIAYNYTSLEGGGIYINGFGKITDSHINGNGGGNGGGVYAGGALTVSNCEIKGNGGDNGGGIYANGKLTMDTSTIASNFASGDGGGVYQNVPGTIKSSTFTSNTAEGNGGGLRAVNGNLDMLVQNCTFTYNRATGTRGGGMYADTATVTHSTFTGNLVGKWQTAIGVSNDPLGLGLESYEYEYNPTQGYGAGLYLDKGRLLLTLAAGNYDSKTVIRYTDEEGIEQLIPSNNDGADVWLGGRVFHRSDFKDSNTNTLLTDEYRITGGSIPYLWCVIGADVQSFMDFTTLAKGKDANGNETTLYAGKLADNGGPTQTVALYSSTGIYGPSSDRDAGMFFRVKRDSGIYDYEIRAVTPEEINIIGLFDMKHIRDIATDQCGKQRSLTDSVGENPGAFHFTLPYRVTVQGDPSTVQYYETPLTSSPIRLTSLRQAINTAQEANESDIVVDMSIDAIVIQETVDAKEARLAQERRELAIKMIILGAVVLAAVVISVATLGAASLGTGGLVTSLALTAVNTVEVAVFGSLVPTATIAIATASAVLGTTMVGLATMGVGMGMMSEFETPPTNAANYDPSGAEGQRVRLMDNVSVNMGRNAYVQTLPEEKYQYISFTVEGVVLDSPLNLVPVKGMNPQLKSLTIKGAIDMSGAAVTMLTNRNRGPVIKTDREITITLENLIITGTDTKDYAAIHAPNAHVILRNCYFYDNTEGGAVKAKSVTIENSVFENNMAPSLGGAVSAPGLVKISNSRFINNQVRTDIEDSYGGAVFSSNNIEVENTLFRGNKGRNGAALYAKNSITLRTAEISGSSTGGNWGEVVRGKNVSLTNVTIANNNSTAVYASANASLNACTLSANGGHGVWSPITSVTASIVAGNGDRDVVTDNLSSTLSLLNIPEYDLADFIETTRVSYNGKSFVAGRLADNGGFGNTVAINPIGPAYDAVGYDLAIALKMPLIDGRGMNRMDGGEAFDIGAFEARVFYADITADTPTNNLRFLTDALDRSLHSGYDGNVIIINNPLERSEVFSSNTVEIRQNVSIIARPNAAGGPGLNISARLETVKESVTTRIYDSSIKSGDMAWQFVEFKPGLKGWMWLPVIDYGRAVTVDYNPGIIRVANISFQNTGDLRGGDIIIIENAGWGGAINSLTNSGRAEAYNCTFIGNRNGTVWAQSVLLSNCLFMNNSAVLPVYREITGGAVTLYPDSSGNISKIVNSTFHGNKSLQGSVICRRDGHTSPIILTSNTITGNLGDGAFCGITPENLAEFNYNLIAANYNESGQDSTFGSSVEKPKSLKISSNNVIAGITPNVDASVFDVVQRDSNKNKVGKITDFGGGRYAVLPNTNPRINPGCVKYNQAEHANLPMYDYLGEVRVSEPGDLFYYGAIQNKKKAIIITTEGEGQAIANIKSSDGPEIINITSAMPGEKIKLLASPHKDHRFVRWSVISGGITLSSTSSINHVEFTMPDNDVEVMALFEAEETVINNPSFTSITVPPALPNVVATPSASPSGGTIYSPPQNVTLTCATAGAEIYYTTDGSVPTTSSTLYTAGSAISISTTTTLKAIAVKAGHSNSYVMTETYTRAGIPVFLTYDINLSQTSTYSFGNLTVGYGAQTPLTVTITNAGTGDATNLAVALSGTNSSDFTVTQPASTTLTGSDTTTFTVVPKTGLSANTYSATVTVTGNNSISKTFDITVNVSSGLYTVSGTIIGSDAPSGLAATVQLKNSGGTNVGSSVTASANGTYTIPNVPVGTGYTIDVSMTGYVSNTISAVDVSGNVSNINLTLQKVQALTYDINLSQTSTYSFGNLTVGYGAQIPLPVTITNAGTGDATNLTVALSGTNSSDFTVTQTVLTTLTGSGSTTFTVEPRTGLSANVTPYTATVTVTGDNGISETFDIAVRVMAVVTLSYSLASSNTINDPIGASPLAIGGTGSYVSYAVTVGSLPTGISLNTATGMITGTLSVTGTFPVTISVTDSDGNIGTCSITFTITP